MTADSMLRRVGVVIVTYNSATVVAKTLTAMSLDRLADLVIVDNQSDDDTLRVVRAAAPRATVLPQDRNLGFGAGCNVGLAALKPCEFVLLLNPDAVITDDDLSALARYLDENPTVGMVGPRLYRDGSPLTSAGVDATLRSELRTVVPGPVRRWFPDRRLPAAFGRTGAVGYVEGACMLLRRELLRDIGGFDERYFLFYEEQDLAQQLRRRRLTVDLLASARAEHAGRVSRQSVPLEARPTLLRSAALYLDKWHGHRVASAYRGVATTSIALQRLAGRLSAGDARALRRGLSQGGR